MMKIIEITENKKQYLDLLLLADEQENMIDRYLNKGRMYVLDDKGIKCECVVTNEGNGVLVLFISHWITGIYMFIPWLEPFQSMSDIMRYGALPRCLQYCGCFFLILFMMERYKKLLVQFGMDDNSEEVHEAEDKDPYFCYLRKAWHEGEKCIDPEIQQVFTRK